MWAKKAKLALFKVENLAQPIYIVNEIELELNK